MGKAAKADEAPLMKGDEAAPSEVEEAEDEDHEVKVKLAQGVVANSMDAATIAVIALATHGRKLKPLDVLGYLVSIALHICAQLVQLLFVRLTFQYKVEVLEDMYEGSSFLNLEGNLSQAIATNVALTSPTLTAYMTPTQVGVMAAADARCRLPHSPAMLQYMFMFLFCGVAIQELSSCWRRIEIMWLMPTESPYEFHEEENNPKKKVSLTPPAEENDIDHMNLFSKFIVCIFILVPYAVTTACVGWTGAKFLALIKDPAKAAKTSLKLGMIINITKQLFGYFASESIKKNLKKASYVILTNKPSKRWNTWGSSIATMLAAWFLAVFIFSGIFSRISVIEHLCIEYVDRFPGGAAVRRLLPSDLTAWE